MSTRYHRPGTYKTRDPRAATNPLRSLPLIRPAAAVFGTSWFDGTWNQPKAPPAPRPALPEPVAAPGRAFLVPTALDRARTEVANAEAALKEARHCYVVARADIGDANRTVLKGDKYSPDRRLTPQRVRERKSYAFRMLNKRRAQLNASERRVDAARVALAALGG